MQPHETSDRAAMLTRQRKALADFGFYALQETDLDKLLTEAARQCAEGLGVRFGKVLEYRPGANDLIIRAGVGWKDNVVGRAIARVDMCDPSGRTILMREPVVIEDVNEVGAYNLPPIYPQHGIQSAANVPILGVEEVCYGVLEADSTQARRFEQDDLDFLQAYANVITGAIANLARLVKMRRENEALVDLLREQQHRIRNNLQSIATQLQTSAEDPGSLEEAEQRFRAVESRVFALASLYDHLIGTDLGSQVDLAAYLRGLVERAGKFHEADARVVLVARIDLQPPPMLDPDSATALGTVVNELVANAAEHAFGERGGRIEVRLMRDAEARPVIEVADDGRGFRVDYAAGLGLSLVRRLVARAGATLDLQSKAGRTVWTIRLEPPC